MFRSMFVAAAMPRRAIALACLALVASFGAKAQLAPSAPRPFVEEIRQQERERALREQQERAVDQLQPPPPKTDDNLTNTNGGDIVQTGATATTLAVAGTINNKAGTGEDVFGSVDAEAGLTVVAEQRRPTPEGDVVVGHADADANMHRTAGAMPVFRMPPPALPKYQPPVYIYTPGYTAPALPDRSILIELRSNLTEQGDNIFETADVLQKLGPRIKRLAPATPDAQRAITPSTS